MKQADTWSDGGRECQVACSIGGGNTCQRHRPIVRGRTVEVPAKRPREDFVAGEASLHRDFQYRLLGRRECGGGAREPQPLRILFWSLAGKLAESVVQVKSRPSAACRQHFQRYVVVWSATDVAKYVKNVVGSQWTKMIAKAWRRCLMFLAICVSNNNVTSSNDMSYPGTRNHEITKDILFKESFVFS
jgi:hypothetical protein